MLFAQYNMRYGRENAAKTAQTMSFLRIRGGGGVPILNTTPEFVYIIWFDY